jgi:hypothetical protein
MIENQMIRNRILVTGKCIRGSGYTTKYRYPEHYNVHFSNEHRIRVPQAAVLRVESHRPPSRHPRT